MLKVSVIIPIYNVNAYIEKCARSLFEQSLQDIEYLFIDDCSPDNSVKLLMKILEEYPNRKKNCIIHRMEQNSGQAMVRKWGMSNASGEYVIHCDSDDWVEPTMYELLYNKAKQCDSDIVFCDYRQFFSPSHSVIVNRKLKETEEQETILKYLMQGSHHLNYLWAAMIKRVVYLNKIHYPLCNQGEDWTMMVQIVLNSKRFDYVNLPLYNYWCNETSITRRKTESDVTNRVKGAVTNRELIYSILEEKKLREKYEDLIVASKYQCKLMLLPLMRKQGVRQYFMNTFPEINRKIIFNKYISLRKKMYLFIVALNLWKPL